MADAEVLTGTHVVLRRPELDDAEVLFAELTTDHVVTRYLSWTPHPDVGETRRVIAEVLNTGDASTWLIRRRDTDELVGTCGWTRPQPHSIELGYCLCQRWWGRGLATEAAGLLVEAAQRQPTVYRVSAYCHVDNVASAAVLRNVGMHLEGRLARYAVFPNVSAEPQDCFMFGRAVK